MNTPRSLDTHGDPIGTVRNLVKALWLEGGLDGMLATFYEPDSTIAGPRLVEKPDQLDDLNPFKPLMTINTARIVPHLLQEYPQARLGALLRPCEVRALTEMIKRSPLNLNHLLTISVDCLGTLPLDEYQWRAERKESSDGLTQEALQFARQGGIAAYRFRSACQMCQSPEARGAEVNIHVLGLPVRRVILVEARDQATAERLKLFRVTDRDADAELVSQHALQVARVNERHTRIMDRLIEGFGSLLPADVEGVIAQLESCEQCQACMNVCPICQVSPPMRSAEGHYDLKAVTRWLISCAGCGMCEQSCPKHLPLSTIFAYIRQQLDEQWGYTPGRSVDEPLPIM